MKNKKDLGLGVFCVLAAAFIAYMSFQLRATGYEGDPGPKMFPLIGSVILAICGIGLIVHPSGESRQFMTLEQWKSAFALFGIYVGFAVLLWLLGFSVAVPVILFITCYLLSGQSLKDATRKARLLRSLIFAVICGALLYLAYIVGLGAKLPTGFLWTLFK